MEDTGSDCLADSESFALEVMSVSMPDIKEKERFPMLGSSFLNSRRKRKLNVRFAIGN